MNILQSVKTLSVLVMFGLHGTIINVIIILHTFVNQRGSTDQEEQYDKWCVDIC